MFRELRLSNFRVFDDEVSIRFRPITVLIGRNSSGKSSLLNLLLMLKQSSMSTRRDFPVVYGDDVQLGNFKELKNTLSDKENLHFDLSFAISPSRFLTRFSKDLDILQGIKEDSLIASLQGQIPYSDTPQDGSLFYALGTEDSPLEYFSHDTVIASDNIFYFDALRNRLNRMNEGIGRILDAKHIDPDDVRNTVLRAWRSEVITYEIGTNLHNEFQSFFHFPAIRGEIKRQIDLSDMTREISGRIREDTASQLYRIVEDDSEQFQFLTQFLSPVASLDSVRFEELAPGILKPTAENVVTGAKVPLADFGFGISQCLPILVKGTAMPPHSCLMVEQPEAQLHPTAQLEFGSFFAKLWTERTTSSIIETHSSNILLRLRRLIAMKKLSNQDVSIAYFTVSEENGNTPIVENIDINEDGSLEPGLPMEFFAKDIIEALSLGTGT